MPTEPRSLHAKKHELAVKALFSHTNAQDCLKLKSTQFTFDLDAQTHKSMSVFNEMRV